MQKFWFKYLRMMAAYSQAQFQWFQFSHRAIPETLKAPFADLLNGTQRKKYQEIWKYKTVQTSCRVDHNRCANKQFHLMLGSMLPEALHL